MEDRKHFLARFERKSGRLPHLGLGFLETEPMARNAAFPKIYQPDPIRRKAKAAVHAGCSI
jgi:hypothetical protein